MKPAHYFMVMALFAFASPLSPQGTPKKSTPLVARPTILSEVRAGMERDTVFAGLGDGYTFKRLGKPTEEIDAWGVYSKSSSEEALISFKNGKVDFTWKNLTTGTGPEVMTLYRGLFEELYFRSMRRPDSLEPFASKTELPVIIEFNEVHAGDLRMQKIIFHLDNESLAVVLTEKPSYAGVTLERTWW